MQTFNYFMSLDMPVMELLGSSETGGPQTACLKVPFLSAFLTFGNGFLSNIFPGPRYATRKRWQILSPL